MKITCACGATIFDLGSYRGHLLSDAALQTMLEAIDGAIESRLPLSAQARCMQARMAVSAALRAAWQCSACGRLYISAEGGALQEWQPAGDGPAAPLFSSG
jgi:hypothetical protein